MTKNKSKRTAPIAKSGYRRTSTGNSTTPKMTKGTVSFIEKLAEKDSKRKKKKEAKKTEAGNARRLAKYGLIDKDKVKAARKSPSKYKKKNKKKKGSSSTPRPLPHTLTHPPLAQTHPAIRTTPRAMSRRGNRETRSPAKTTSAINPQPKLRAKLRKKIRYRSSHNPWRTPS